MGRYDCRLIDDLREKKTYKRYKRVLLFLEENDVFTPALPSCCGRDGRFYRPPAEDVCTPRIRSVIILVLFHRIRVRKGSNNI